MRVFRAARFIRKQLCSSFDATTVCPRVSKTGDAEGVKLWREAGPQSDAGRSKNQFHFTGKL